jgi:hypothetical protein
LKTNYIQRFLQTTLLVVCCLMMLCTAASAQKRTRILFLMDASSSMTYNWQTSQNRFEAAAKVVGAIIDSMYAVNNEVEFAVRIYGDQYESIEKNCTDTRLVVPFNLQNLYQIKNKLKYIRPLGSSPIAYSLQQASENELSNTDLYDYSFVLVTDGGESCGGDICDMYKKIVANKIKVAPYIIGLDTNRLLQNYYQCLGQYVAVTTPADIAKAAKLITDNNRPLLEKTKTLNIVAKVEPPVKIVPPVKVEPPVKIDVIVPPVLDELAKIPSLLPKQIIVNSNPPKKYTKYTESAKIPSALLVTTAPQLDAMDKISSVTSVKNALNFTREFKVQKPRKLGNIFLPEQLVAEKIEEGVIMQKINVDLQNNPIAQNARAIVGLTKNSIKAKLPTAITEKEFEPADMSMIALAKNSAKNSVLDAKQLTNRKNNYKPSLPAAITEKEFEAIAMMPISQARPGVVVASVDAKKISLRKNVAYQLPNILFIPEFKPDVMEQIFAAQFRITNISNINYVKMPEQLAKRNAKPSALPKALAVVKREIVKPPVDEKVEFKLETEPSADTRIAVYFTDGYGKFYNAKPMVALQDVTSKKSIKTFMRDVLPSGDPEPVKLDIDGTFDVSVLGQKDITLANVVIEKNKLNKIILKVSNGTLIFTYQNNRIRPVDHIVKVRRVFSGKKIDPIIYNAMNQKVFEPGEYQIELDILPKYVVHTEISFGAVTEIQVPQEGLMNIINNAPANPVTLYYQSGDTYEEFMTIPMTGDASKQNLYLRPGSYKASFVLPGMPKMAPPTIVSFQIKQNQETTFELKDYRDLTITPSGIGKPVYINEKPKIEFINANLDANGKEIIRRKIGTPPPPKPQPKKK